jgi:D-beta-D-heptose 7-phosphate kinase/D-beta-D-heptose 1-phosphate adenosyltransferase
LFERRFINDKDALGRTIESLRMLGMKITLTSGSFDLLHVGHAKYLERASEYGDILVVGVDSDAKIKARKGPSRPVVGEDERLRLLSHIRGVDLLTLKEPDEEKWGLIKLVRPDTLIVTAETYGPDEIKELEQKYCKRVVVLEPQATTSTGAQIRRIQIGERHDVTQAIEEIIEENGVSDELKRELARVVNRLQGK